MKNIIRTCLLFALCASFVACGPTQKYEDTNGEDNFELQTITDQEIIDRSVGASGLGYSETKVAGIVSKEYSSKNFNGVEQIYHTSFILPSDVILYVGHVNVKSGNFKIAIVNDDKIIDEIPLDSFAETIYYENLEGDFSVHLAGESAKFELFLEVQ